MKVIYKGELGCQSCYKSGEACREAAYYIQNGSYRCGRHSDKTLRRELPVDPNRSANITLATDARDEVTMEIAAENFRRGKKGQVMTTKIHGMKNPKHTEGFMSIFPNFAHENRKDGVGMSSLSPMKIGPIGHYCPDVGPAGSLEKLWQGSKQYNCESNKDGTPSPEYFETRNFTFLSKKPSRHKKVSDPDSGVKHSVFYDEHGKIHFLGYIESRQVYCVIYEFYAEQTDDFKLLREMVDSGVNVNLIGYDAHDVKKYKGKTIVEQFEMAYLDPKYPFGHEMCLQAMLLLKREERPWRKYHTINVFKP